MLQTAVIYANKRQQRTLKGQVSSVLTTYADSMLVEVTAQQLERLTDDGYSIEVLDGIDEIDVGGEIIDTSVSPPSISTAAVGTSGVSAMDAVPHHYLVQFIGPIKDEWLQAVAEAGGTLREPLPSYAYVVELSEDAYETVHRLDFVRWIGYYEPNLRVSPDLRESLAEPTIARVVLHLGPKTFVQCEDEQLVSRSILENVLRMAVAKNALQHSTAKANSQRVSAWTCYWTKALLKSGTCLSNTAVPTLAWPTTKSQGTAWSPVTA